MKCVVPLLLAAGVAIPAQAVTLAQATASALEHNHDLRLASLAVRGADAAVTSAAAAPNPTLTLQTFNINPAVGVGAGSLRDKTVDSTVRLDQLIERGGKRAYRTASAQGAAQAARADAADVRRQLERDTGMAFFDLLAAQQRAHLMTESAQLSEQALATAERRSREGDLAKADVARVRVDAVHARSDADSAQAELALARLALAVLVGGSDDAAGMDAEGDWDQVPLPPAEADIEERSDIRAARARVEAARAARDLARAARTRDVSVGVQFEHYPVSAANPQGTGNSVGLALQVPLFLRYAYDGEIRGAEAALDSAQENLAKLRQLARIDADKAGRDARAKAARVARYDASILPAAKQAADSAEFAFAHGAMGVMDILDARRTWRAVQLEAIAARADDAKARLTLRAALQKDQP